MSIPGPPPPPPKPNRRSNSELSLYDNLVKWYTGKSAGVHKAVLAFWIILLLVELAGFIVNPPYMMKLASSTGCSVEGYKAYTPTIWLAGVFTGMALYFVMRYSRVFRMRARARHFASNFKISRGWQYAIIDLTFVTVAVEVFLIWKTKWTISSLSRGVAITHPWLYFVFGLVAAAVVFVITDLKRLPRMVRFSLAIWVAIVTHIFWWITPIPVAVAKFWGG